MGQSQIKALTGDNPVAARFMRQDFFIPSAVQAGHFGQS